VFGFSFSELVVLVIVALIVIGPKDLPKVLRKLGMWAGKLRRMAADLRAQSGIDDVLRTEGLSEDIAEIRKLARGELDDVRRAVTTAGTAAAAGTVVASARSDDDPLGDIDVDPQREYPREGADGYLALPDTAILYADTFPKSALARDPLYVLGDKDAKLPDEEGAAATSPADASGTPTATATPSATATATTTATATPSATATTTATTTAAPTATTTPTAAATDDDAIEDEVGDAAARTATP
jgi:sec-independent protein translocase protein TatB